MSVSLIAVIVLLLSLVPGSLLVTVMLLSRHLKAGARGFDRLIKRARVETILKPDGAIIWNGELLPARIENSVGTIAPGSFVNIVGASGHLLVVEPSD